MWSCASPSSGGRVLPAPLAPRRRIDRALLAVVMEAEAHGTSTGKLDDLVKARVDGRSSPERVIATGVTTDGGREVSGWTLVTARTAPSGAVFLRSPKPALSPGSSSRV
jgi:transposase-like protein